MYMENDKLKIKYCLFGSLVTLVITIILSVILSLMAKLMPALSDQILKIAAYVILGISSLLGGIMSGKGTQSGGIIYGVITAFVTMLIIKIIELLTTGSISQLGNYMFSALAIFLPTVTGQILGVNSK